MVNKVALWSEKFIFYLVRLAKAWLGQVRLNINFFNHRSNVTLFKIKSKTVGIMSVSTIGLMSLCSPSFFSTIGLMSCHLVP